MRIDSFNLPQKFAEWHVWPYEWSLSDAKNRVVAAFKTFSKTKNEHSLPMAYADVETFGFHDDSFAFSTLEQQQTETRMFRGSSGLL